MRCARSHWLQYGEWGLCWCCQETPKVLIHMNILPFIYNIIYLVELFPVALVPFMAAGNPPECKKKRKCVFFLLMENRRHCGEWNLAVDLGGDGRFCWNGQKTSKLFNLLTEIFSHILCVCVFGTLTYFIFVDSNSLVGKQWLDVHPSVHSSTIHKNHYSKLRILVRL